MKYDIKKVLYNFKLNSEIFFNPIGDFLEERLLKMDYISGGLYNSYESLEKAQDVLKERQSTVSVEVIKQNTEYNAILTFKYYVITEAGSRDIIDFSKLSEGEIEKIELAEKAVKEKQKKYKNDIDNIYKTIKISEDDILKVSRTEEIENIKLSDNAKTVMYDLAINDTYTVNVIETRKNGKRQIIVQDDLNLYYIDVEDDYIYTENEIIIAVAYDICKEDGENWEQEQKEVKRFLAVKEYNLTNKRLTN